MRRSFAFLSCVLVSCSTPPAPVTAPPRLSADVAFLADDSLMGREAGTAGYDKAADYVTARMKEAGLSPGPEGWRQTVPMRSARRDSAAARFTLAFADGGEKTLVHLEDYLIGRSYEPSFGVTAPLVYAGYGVVAPDDGVDDYAGLDVSGKIVVAFSGAPPAFDSERRAFYDDADKKLAAAAARGAAGFVSMPTIESAERRDWARIVANAGATGMNFVGADGFAHDPAPGVRATAGLNISGAEKLFSGERLDYAALAALEAKGDGAPEGFSLSKSATIAGASILNDLESDNVIGMIKGRDPALSDEVILITAHLDHVGVSRSAKPGEDAINNGALDNAAGVAVLLEAARLLADGEPPRRTIAFAALAAEEKGLVGSDYLARHPAFGGGRVVANINLDMPLALYPFTDVVAFGAERSSIGPVIAAAAESMGIALAADPLPEENIFVRSDHYSFVKQGAPSVMLMPGFANGGEAAFRAFLENHYHRPSDDLSLPIDYRALARFAELNRRIARALADANDAPAWVDGDFFGEIFSD